MITLGGCYVDAKTSACLHLVQEYTGMYVMASGYYLALPSPLAPLLSHLCRLNTGVRTRKKLMQLETCTFSNLNRVLEKL